MGAVLAICEEAEGSFQLLRGTAATDHREGFAGVGCLRGLPQRQLRDQPGEQECGDAEKQPAAKNTGCKAAA